MSAISLDDASLKKLVSEAILMAITQEQRGELMVKALASLIEPQEGQYGRKHPSRIEEAFTNAASRIAEGQARELLEKDPAFQEKLKGLMMETMERAFTGNAREKIISAMVEAFRKGMTGDRY